MKPNYVLNNKEKRSIEKFLEDMLIESKEDYIEISFSYNEHYCSEEKINNQNIYLRQLKSMEINDWITYSLKNKVKKEIYNKKSFILLITNEGEILEIKSIRRDKIYSNWNTYWY